MMRPFLLARRVRASSSRSVTVSTCGSHSSRRGARPSTRSSGAVAAASGRRSRAGRAGQVPRDDHRGLGRDHAADRRRAARGDLRRARRAPPELPEPRLLERFYSPARLAATRRAAIASRPTVRRSLTGELALCPCERPPSHDPQLVGRQRRAQQVALDRVAAEPRELVVAPPAVSTPSATTSSPRSWPSVMIERTIAASSASRCHVEHERAVDLELRDRQPREVGERRVAGAEVVDRDADAERLEALEIASFVPTGSAMIALSVISSVRRSPAEVPRGEALGDLRRAASGRAGCASRG